MVEKSEEKTSLSSLTRLEQLALLSTILVWTGVVVFGIGLAIALYNVRTARVAYAQLRATDGTASEALAIGPAPTTQLYPAGWSTATPAPALDPVEENDRSATNDPIEPTSTPTPAPTATPVPVLHPPDRLAIPSIELDSPVVPIGWTTVQHNGETARVWNVVDQVVGWHKTSAYPGHAGNTVLNGHHNIRGEVFRYLVDVQVGDQVIVYARDKAYTYAVTEKHILKEKGEPVEVREENARWIGRTEDERLTMVTCWPYTNNTHRLVVVAKPVSAPEQERVEGSEEP